MERAREERPPEPELELAADAVPPPRTTVRVECPVCRHVTTLQVCPRCGVDVDTGALVQAPARPDAPGAPREVHRVREAPALGWSLRDLGARARQGWFGALVVAWLVFSLQTGPSALIAVGSRGADDGEGGALGLTARILTLFLLAHVLVARTRGVVRDAPAFDLEDLGSALPRALLLVGLLAPCLAGPWACLALAPFVPLVAGAVASERPLADLSPPALVAAARRSEGLGRAALLSTALLGPALMALPVTSPLAVWRPLVLVLAVTVVGVATGLARRGAEARGDARGEA